MTNAQPASEQRSAERGFTIIELLISLAVLALILVLLAGGLRALSHNWDANNHRLENIDMNARAYDILSRDLAALQRVFGGAKDAVRYVFTGEPTRLLFVVNEPRFPTQAGAYFVEYAIRQNGAHSEVVRSRSPYSVASLSMPEPSASERVVLLKSKRVYELAYGDKSTSPSRWLDSWGIVDKLPDLIRLQERDGKTGVPISPPMIVALRADAELTCISDKVDLCSAKSRGSIAEQPSEESDGFNRP